MPRWVLPAAGTGMVALAAAAWLGLSASRAMPGAPEKAAPALAPSQAEPPVAPVKQEPAKAEPKPELEAKPAAAGAQPGSQVAAASAGTAAGLGSPPAAAPARAADTAEGPGQRAGTPEQKATQAQGPARFQGSTPVSPAVPAVAQVAQVDILTDPPAQVYVNGVFVSASPAHFSGAVGRVQVRVFDSVRGVDKIFPVELTVGDNGRKVLAVASRPVEFRVTPWATVFVDGNKLGDTPFDGPVSLYEGKHKVKLVNPELGVNRALVLDVGAGPNVVKARLDAE